MFVDTTFTNLENDNPRNAVVGGKTSKLHTSKSLTLDDEYSRVAFPNDRAQSIRPSDRHENYK